jgi:hypothetical protein
VTTALIQALGALFILWKNKESTKYLDEYLELKEIIDEQRRLPANKRDNIVFDRALDRLRGLAHVVSSNIVKSDFTSGT